MPARARAAASLPLGTAPPLPPAPPPPTPDLRLGSLSDRAKRLRARGGGAGPLAASLARRATRRRPGPPGGRTAPADQIQRAPITQRAAAKQAAQRDARDRAQAAAQATPPQPGLGQTVGQAVGQRAKETARLHRTQMQQRARATAAKAPPPSPPAEAPAPRKGHVTDQLGRQVGHLRGPAHNAPSEPAAEQDRVSRFFGEGRRNPDEPRASRQARKPPAPAPAPPASLEEQRDALARVEALKARAKRPGVAQRAREGILKRSPRRVREAIPFQRYEAMFGEVPTKDLTDEQIGTRLDWIREQQRRGDKSDALLKRKYALERERRERQGNASEQLKPEGQRGTREDGDGSENR